MADQVSAATKRRTPFYGWWIVALGFTNNFCAAGFGTYAFSVFVKSMSDDPSLGWSRTELVWAVTLSSIVSTATGPLIGPLLDRKHGPRVSMVLIGLAGGLGLALLSQVSHLWQYYLLFGVLAAFQQHTPIFLVVPTVVSKWFIRQRGRALVLSTMGRPLSGIVLLPTTQLLISAVGWRTAWLTLGIIAAAILVPANGLLMRRRPEDMGLTPDGDPPTKSEEEGAMPALPAREDSWTLASAIRTRPFWLMLVANNLGVAGLIGVLINQVAYLGESFSDTVAVAGATFLTLVSFTGRALWVPAADRVDARYSVIGAYLMSGLGMLFLINATSIPVVILFGLTFGLGMAGMDPLMSQVWASYYGRAFLGSIRGFVTLTNLVSFAGAPLFVAFLSDVTGDYRYAFLVFLVAFSVAALLMYFARRPQAPKGEEAIPLLAQP
ncbi:MAG: MFS transporter [Dehalococcoidia bacterium]